MKDTGTSRLLDILKQHERELLAEWISQQLAAVGSRRDLLPESELQQQSRQFLAAFSKAAHSGDLDDVMAPAWEDVRALLQDLSQSRALQGFSPS
jgi:rsbT co-antagonist protein RsbR